jgi:hypothetical protein
MCLLCFSALCSYSQSISPVEVTKWEQSYTFDAFNQFRVTYYSPDKKQSKVREYKTYYQKLGMDFYVKLSNDRNGNLVEILFDNRNRSVIQIIASIDNIPPLYNVGNYYIPHDTVCRKFDLIPTVESKSILGYKCKKYNFTHNKVVGDFWIADTLKISNDIGILRASRLLALCNRPSVDGFIMEINYIDSSGGRTEFSTVSLQNNETLSVDLQDVIINQLPSKINYFVY